MIAYHMLLSLYWYEHFLCSFPIYAAFPHVEYYEHSVAIGVATLRRSHVPVV